MIRAIRETVGSVFSTRHIRWMEFAWPALLLAAGLLFIGLVFIDAMSLSQSNLGGSGAAGRIDFENHKQKVLVAIPVFFAGLFLRPMWLRRFTPLIYLACIALLVLVQLIGDERNNAKRWIQLPRFDLQPSELAKVGTILMLAKVLQSSRLDTLGEWLKPLLVALLPMVLVAIQPDLGTALTIVPVTLGLIYLAGGSGVVISAMLGATALSGFLAFQSGLLQGYQMERVETWIESFDTDDLIAARNGTAFHTFYARTFTGNGGAFGRGLGEGVANETGLLPERDCDSIIAVIAEEWGFYRTAALILAYGLMVVFLMISASGLRDRYARLVVGGVAIYFAAHLFINVSVNVGLLPMTGLTLPLLSTGGSSLLATFLALGLALGLGSHHERDLGSDAFRRY
ncbi:Peptidoglycan glycosyltransferase MrdB [Planctomycetes bacterium Poly30]|uniref:Peptidoglycan glycosyltransferase MrdB n=1 Tax=Saltatorellus ferox TaxID=2528018 RepID=A0A518EQX7_9BACT|nr:Peptidoglycan glycosyltransferase MrdB [Planctomycetes bacterium Poly30]